MSSVLASITEALEDLRQTQSQLVQSERLAAIGELAAGIAHEVNNPVNFSLNAARALGESIELLLELPLRVSALNWEDVDQIALDGRRLNARIQELDVEDLVGSTGELTKIVTEGLSRTETLIAGLLDFGSPGERVSRSKVDVRTGVVLANLRHFLRHFAFDLAVSCCGQIALVYAEVVLPGDLV